MKIGVLGAGGFIGSRIVEMLHLDSPFEAVPIVHNFSKMAYLSKFNLNWKFANGFDYKELRTAFRHCDVVIHSIAGDVKTILGTLESVYKAAEDVGIKRLIYLSSSSVHGQAPIKGTDENSDINEKQSVPYNNAKALAEKKLFELRRKGKVELVILRPGIVYGPRSYWIGNFANSLLRGNAYLIDRGAGICNGIYIDNLVHAIKLSITTKQADGNVFLVGDKEQYTWAEIYSPIADALGFDIEKIPEGILPEQKKDWMQYFEKIQNSVIYKYAVRIFPFKLRIAAYTGLTAFLTASDHQSPWKFSTEHSPAATMEMALLYKCQYKFPYKKAKEVLGYEPIVSFSEACRRTVEWLGYAGYPINDTLLLEFVRKTC